MNFINQKKTLTAFIFLSFFTLNTEAQNYFIYGEIRDSLSAKPVDKAEIYSADGKPLSTSDKMGYFQFYTAQKKLDIFILRSRYKIYKNRINIKDSTFIDVKLSQLSVNLSEVEINEKRKRFFALENLNDIVGTSIYAGKKTEVVLINKNTSGLALNNARQIYRQVAGLNIYQNDDAGIQLNIGGRGLDPNRTANFNTRQNGYDISADVLGYPESYYTPPAEALERIEIIRGAASLQYGTQFGGLINFILKSPSQIEGNKYVIRSTSGSNGLLSNFISIDGTNKNFSYYSFINHKRGNGFRNNSNFESKNKYIHISKQINEKLVISCEITQLDYIAQQPGGLNDEMFHEDPLQSNRTRNWFKVNWQLYNLKANYKQSKKALHSLSIFGLDAERFALGYRSNRVAQSDPMIERDLIHGEFNNCGIEYRLLLQHKISNIKTANLIGFKFYKSDNKSKQGPGSSGIDADFNFYSNLFPYYKNQSSYIYPNLNTAIFMENIIYINKNLSITPGLRYEKIETQSDGKYVFILVDGANNPITNTTTYKKNYNSRNFILLGLGVSYKKKRFLEAYANISQNYRSVTFADISIINPAYVINPNISDEKGYTADIGFRGNVRNRISYDINLFYLLYKQRIGFIQKIQNDGSVKSERGNIGDARISGLESLIDINIVGNNYNNIKCNYYINTSLIQSEYINSQQNGIKGNTVEFIPKINLKTGFNITYRSISSNIQYTYLSQQFTDASNAIEGNLSGIIGEIPKYEILDLGFSYKKGNIIIEYGVNNILDKPYFTRRSTGYPGPGIIPSPQRNYYLSFELNF